MRWLFPILKKSKEKHSRRRSFSFFYILVGQKGRCFAAFFVFGQFFSLQAIIFRNNPEVVATMFSAEEMNDIKAAPLAPALITCSIFVLSIPATLTTGILTELQILLRVFKPIIFVFLLEWVGKTAPAPR